MYDEFNLGTICTHTDDFDTDLEKRWSDQDMHTLLDRRFENQWPWFGLSRSSKVKGHDVNWKAIYDILYVFHKNFDNKMQYLWDGIFDLLKIWWPWFHL